MQDEILARQAASERVDPREGDVVTRREIGRGKSLEQGVHHSRPDGVIAAGLAGNVAGSYAAWAVGRFGAEPAVRRLAQGRWAGEPVAEHDIDAGIAWFTRHGSRAVLIGRVLPVVRTFISLPAGIAEMPALRFGIYTTIGCLPWTTALAVAGYAVGKNWESIASAFHGPTFIIAAGVVVALVVAAWRYRRRRTEDGGAAGEGLSGR